MADPLSCPPLHPPKKKYVILTTHSPFDLENQVNNLMLQGYTVSGGVSVDKSDGTRTYVQAMVIL